MRYLILLIGWWILLSSSWCEVSNPAARTAMQHDIKGLALLRRGDLVGAAAEFRAAIQNNPDAAEALKHPALKPLLDEAAT